MILQVIHSWPMLAHELPLLHERLHSGQRNSPNTLPGPWCGVFCESHQEYKRAVYLYLCTTNILEKDNSTLKVYHKIFLYAV